jgi:hypothetical protein
MSNPSAHLNRQFGVISAFIYNELLDATKYAYRGYRTERAKHFEYKTVSPVVSTVTLGAGNYTDFELPPHADKIGQISIKWDQSALTTTGGTYRRFCDYFPLVLVEKIDLVYGSNTVFTHRPEKKFWKIKHHLSQESLATESALLFGELSTTQRNTLAAATQTVIYNVDFPFCLGTDRFLELRALAYQPTVRVWWRNLNNVVQTDGTAFVSTVSNISLIAYQLHFDAEERDLHVFSTETDHGLIKLHEEAKVDYSTAQNMIPTGTSGEFEIELKHWKTEIRFLAFFLRPRANITPPNPAKNLWYETHTFRPINRFRILTGSNEEVIPWIDGKFNLYVMHEQYYFGIPGAVMYFYSWDDHPVDEMNPHGAYNFQGLVNPKLVLDLGTTALTEDYDVTIIRSMWNFHQLVRGDLSKQFEH